jgi:hypothetical protein
MTLISFQDGRLVLRGGKVGTEQACCCQECAPCPDLESLCISITLTDYNGTVYTADQDDIVWFGNTGTIYFADFEYAVTIACDIEMFGGISVTAGWAGLIDSNLGCICTSGRGDDAIPCSSDLQWYEGTASGTMFFDDIGIPCEPDCPETLGTFSVTFSDPPC